jgi:exocyst complex component 1
MENGISPEEISYEQQFSRIELKRVTSSYPAKEIKKGLENLYKKIEKHLSSNDSLLLQVVWRQMQVSKKSRFFLNFNISKCLPSFFC